MKKLFAITFSLLAGITTVSAQNWCGTVEQRNNLYADRPEDAALLEQRLEAFNQSTEENNLHAKFDEHYVIPVVFHVIHEEGVENISLEQIEDQIRIINEDFARQNPDTNNTPSVFAAHAGDSQIEFRLAKLDPNGNCTQGVTRTYSSLTHGARDNVKSLIQWDPHHYLNVWVVRTIENFSSDGGIVLGFAQFPDQLWTDAATDGIVLRHDYCGSIGTAEGTVGRTLTHEAGHWLHLRHIWGDDDCGNDYVNDTPTAQEPNYGVCDTNGDAVGGAYPYHVGNCDASSGQTISQENGEMFMNYMDYSDDQCMNMFSLGQGARMHNAITTYRSAIVTEANLIATGTNDEYVTTACPPIAEFSSNANFGCTGDGFNFTDQSYNTNEISSYQWTFEGGTPATSTEEAPSVVYNSPGEYDVTLTVTNSVGESTMTKAGQITISPEEAATMAPYFKTFENSAFPNHTNENLNWALSVSDDQSWERTTVAASPNASPISPESNNASVRIRSSEFENLGELHTMITPTIDLSNTEAPIRAYFDLAYAKKNSNTMDNLKVHVTDDCGRTWTKRLEKDSDDMATNGGGTSFFEFIPTDSQWEQFSANLNAFSGESNIQVKFEFTGQDGNWLYIDNFFIANSDELFIDENKKVEFNVFPNPSNGDATIECNLATDAKITFTIQNVYGATIAQKVLNLKANANSIQLSDIHPSLSAGVYLIQLNQNGSSVTKKIVITK